MLNVQRWTSPRAIKETFDAPVGHTYPHQLSLIQTHHQRTGDRAQGRAEPAEVDGGQVPPPTHVRAHLATLQ